VQNHSICCYFFVLKLGQPLTKFEKMKQLFEFLKVKNTPYKH